MESSDRSLYRSTAPVSSRDERKDGPAVVLYQLGTKFVDNDYSIPEESKDVMYYALVVGHRTGVVDEASVATEFLVTTHSLPITFLLDELRSCCGRVVFLGIQPAHMEFVGALHPDVQAAVEKIYDFLAKGADFASDIPLPIRDSQE